MVKKMIKKYFFIILGFVITMLFYNFISNALSPEKIRERTLKEIEKYEKVEIVIKQGDTAWKIQKRLTPNEAIDKMLYYAEVLNGKKMGYIKPGETLIFLKEKAGK